MFFHSFIFGRLAVLVGLASWLSIAVINNLFDPDTTILHLGNTLSMALLKEEQVLGGALLSRAWPIEWAEPLLMVVATSQMLIAVFLWVAALGYVRAWRRRSLSSLDQARNLALIALTCFLLLWLFFICGGLWFGYWLKQGAIQSVHMTLILISLGALLWVQSEPARLCHELSKKGSHENN